MSSSIGGGGGGGGGAGSNVLRFGSIIEYCVFVYTCVFLNRVGSFQKLKNNNNKYQNTISPEDG